MVLPTQELGHCFYKLGFLKLLLGGRWNKEANSQVSRIFLCIVDVQRRLMMSQGFDTEVGTIYVAPNLHLHLVIILLSQLLIRIGKA